MSSVDIFKMTFLNVLNMFVPLKKKYARTNHSRFVNKEVNKKVMQRSRLHNKYLLIKNKEMGASAFFVNLKNVTMKI